MNNYRGILFDKDGTLFDFAATWESWAASFLNRLTDSAEAAAELGETIGFDTVNRRFSADSVAIAGTPEDIAYALLTKLPHWKLDDLVNVLNQEAAQAPQAEAVPLALLFEQLKERGMA